jgi:hypothetical protein
VGDLRCHEALITPPPSPYYQVVIEIGRVSNEGTFFNSTSPLLPPALRADPSVAAIHTALVFQALSCSLLSGVFRCPVYHSLERPNRRSTRGSDNWAGWHVRRPSPSHCITPLVHIPTVEGEGGCTW